LGEAALETAASIVPVSLPDSNLAESAAEALGSGIESAADSGVLEGLGEVLGGIFDTLGSLDF
jgi:hypothetical protein